MLEIISLEELELLLARKEVPFSRKAPFWLNVVRSLPCMKKVCSLAPAGTAHHVYGSGIALRCDDRLTIPLCIDCHVIGANPVQEMDSTQFEEAIGLSEPDAIRRVYTLIMDHYNNGNLV